MDEDDDPELAAALAASLEDHQQGNQQQQQQEQEEGPKQQPLAEQPPQVRPYLGEWLGVFGGAGRQAYLQVPAFSNARALCWQADMVQKLIWQCIHSLMVC